MMPPVASAAAELRWAVSYEMPPHAVNAMFDHLPLPSSQFRRTILCRNHTEMSEETRGILSPDS